MHSIPILSHANSVYFVSRNCLSPTLCYFHALAQAFIFSSWSLRKIDCVDINHLGLTIYWIFILVSRWSSIHNFRMQWDKQTRSASRRPLTPWGPPCPVMVARSKVVRPYWERTLIQCKEERLRQAHARGFNFRVLLPRVKGLGDHDQRLELGICTMARMRLMMKTMSTSPVVQNAENPGNRAEINQLA